MVSVSVESMRQVVVGVCGHVFVEREVPRKAWVSNGVSVRRVAMLGRVE